ncbi:peripheral Golgi membrane protein [Ordospora colligata]|nr:peripheral Golgi membrane protein [Ordospora colligata]
MGLCISKIGVLQILKVTNGSISHVNGILPFVHSIAGFNAKAVNSKDDVLTINKEWEEEALVLEILDMRNMETFSIEIPKKNNESLGIAVKFHESPVALLSMQVLRIHPNSPAEKCRMVVGDYILGIENMYSFDEEDLLETLHSKRGQSVPVVVYNNDLGYVRIVRIEIGVEILLGCQIGTGELYRIPYRPRSNRLELNAAIVNKDVDGLARRIRGKEIIDRRMRSEIAESKNSYPVFLNEGRNGMQQKELMHDVYRLHDRKLHETRPSKNVLLSIEDDHEISVYVPDDVMSTESKETSDFDFHDDKSRDIIEILGNTNQDDNFDFEHELPLVCSINTSEYAKENYQAIYTRLDENAGYYNPINTENVYEPNTNSMHEPDENSQSASKYEMQQCPLCLKFHEDEFHGTESQYGEFHGMGFYDGEIMEDSQHKYGYEDEYSVEDQLIGEFNTQEHLWNHNENLERYDTKEHLLEHEVDLEKSMLASENKIAQDIMEMKIQSDIESNSTELS